MASCSYCWQNIFESDTFFLVISQKSANNCTAIRKKIILVKKSVKSPMEQIYIQEKIFDINNDIEDRLTICSPLPLA